MDQFHEMGRAGILAPEARVELIEGELIDMAPIGSRHASVVAALSMAFARGDPHVVVFTQNPVELPPFSEPQPDVLLLAPSAGRYFGALPRPRDVLLVVEVSESSWRYDHDVKLPLYARHGLRETWLVNVPEQRLEAHRDPLGGRYRTRLDFRVGEMATPEALPNLRIELGRLFPR